MNVFFTYLFFRVQKNFTNNNKRRHLLKFWLKTLNKGEIERNRQNQINETLVNYCHISPLAMVKGKVNHVYFRT